MVQAGAVGVRRRVEREIAPFGGPVDASHASSPTRRVPAAGDPLAQATLSLVPRRLRRQLVAMPSPPFAAWERYRRVTLLGEGGMGRVYRAWDPGLDRWVALKFQRCRAAMAGDHLRLEARLLARAESEHVPKVFEVGELAGEPYFAMQFIDGPTLKAARGEMTFGERLGVAVRICRALDAVHERGLVHRDVNPRNLVLRNTALGGWWPYVIDFGIAREAQDVQRRVDPRVLGTASYMAPEQMLGDASRIDRRTDVYSLGATLYELFSGRRPFAAESSEAILTKALREDPAPLAEVVPTLPHRLGEIVARCLDKAPENRYPTARALAADLEDCDRFSLYAFCYHSASFSP